MNVMEMPRVLNPLFRRRDQLNRWQDSETNKSLSTQKESSRVKFELVHLFWRLVAVGILKKSEGY